MHMKFFQAVAYIEDHYEEIMRAFDNPSWGLPLLETWGLHPEDRPALEEEREALRYLVSCRTEIAHDTNVAKPSIEILNRCLERHLQFLETIHRCHAYNVNKHHSKLVQKQYKACRHYLFKFSFPAWYAKMPNEILSFANKYPNYPKF